MLYTIGDLHLSFEASKPMSVFGAEWENHAEKLKENFLRLNEEDICVVCGDLTWGMDMKSCLADFKFIDALNGKKIILKGNHDFWWTTASKASRFFEENGINTISVLNNNCFFYEGTAICGTRGWMCPTENASAHDKKIMQREVQRLETSLKAAGDCEEKICFLHYPPIFGKFFAKDMIDLMHAYGVKECYYGHIHGPGRLYAVEGNVSGISYHLISADHVNFCPVKIK
ncbi:MAG: metallophosphoesterase [Oscillospiraceae bacterium]